MTERPLEIELEVAGLGEFVEVGLAELSELGEPGRVGAIDVGTLVPVAPGTPGDPLPHALDASRMAIAPPTNLDRINEYLPRT